jgi:hypothetical protein
MNDALKYSPISVDNPSVEYQVSIDASLATSGASSMHAMLMASRASLIGITQNPTLSRPSRS